MTESRGAVFLSYASQDAAAARLICGALRAAGIEVWFDESELRGGDAWDRSIRQQIHDCALFVPVISRRTHERLEGYFRREWRLAVERAGDMAENKPFLVPVVIDDSIQRDPSVPEKFRELQWTRLPAGETPPAFIERIRRLLSGSPSSRVERTPATAGSGAGSAPPRSGLFPRRKGMLYSGIGAALLLAVGYFMLDRYHRSTPGVLAAASIAVLPLANESGDPSQQYFADGLSEDLITALSQLPGLKVIGRTSAFQFRDSREDGRSIGAKLGVTHLLEGSVRRSGTTVRVSAELIDTADGSAQWSERYDRPYQDLFALQDEITRAVAASLRTRLLPGEHAVMQSERPPGGGLEAYNALLQGRFYDSRRTEPDLRKAIEFYTQATQLDPGYALAWCALSRSWTTLGAGFLEGAPAAQAYARAREAAERALALAPDLAVAHVARGVVLENADLDWRGAEAEFRHALAIAPHDGEAKFSVASQLATSGEVEPAIELTRQALATEPLRANWYSWLATYLLGNNRLDAAEQAIRRAIELQPSASGYRVTLTIIEVQRGDAQAALVTAQQEVPGVDYDIASAYARQIGGDRSAADAALRKLIENWTDGAGYQIADVYALRGDARGTFEWLDRAWSNRDPGIRALLYDPFMQRYKKDPRFAAFCRKAGLPVPEEPAARKSS